MKWVITGGCGFIGRALIEELLREGGHTVRVLDNLSVGSRSDLATVADYRDGLADPGEWADPLTLIQADIRDSKAVSAALTGSDNVVHLAANTGVPQSVAAPMQDCLTNVVGTLSVLEACRYAGTKRVVFASSGAPLGVQTPPLHEELAPRPASPYGASKLAGEGYCSAYFHCYGLEAVTLRFGNVYGEGSAHKGSVVAKFIKDALNGRPLEIFGDGTQTRDFIHISDLVAAVRSASTRPEIGGETFQIATAQETTVTELADQLLAALKAEGVSVAPAVHAAPRRGDVQRNFSNTAKAHELLGWRAATTLEEGLRRTVRYFLNEYDNTTGDF